MAKNTLIAYINALVPMIFWAFSFIWTKEAYESFGPITTIFLRLIISSVLLFTFLKITGRLIRVEKKDIWKFIILAFFEPFLYFIGESFGLKLVSSTLAAILVSTTPLFSSIIATLFLKEKLNSLNFCGILISFLGLGFMIFKKGFVMAAPIAGITLMMLAVFSSIFYAIFLKNLSNHYSPVNIIAYQNLIGIILFLPVFLIWEVKDISELNLKPKSFIAIIELAIFASTIAFILYTKAIKTIGVAKSNMFINVIPVFTAIFAWIILDETIDIQKSLGIFIVIAGLFISQIKKKKKCSLI